MKSFAVFATVGTTSFDDFVESLCSPPFLTAMAHHHHRHWPRRHAAVATGTSSRSVSPPSSSPSKSAPSSSSASSAPARCGSSCSSSLSSSLGPDSSYSSPDGTQGSSLDLTIQYGTGRCPLSFLPPSLLGASVPRTSDDGDDGGDDGSGWTVLSIPTMAGAARDETSIDGRSSHRVLVRWYRFRPTLAAEMERADAILCHAGAGTLLEALEISASSSSSGRGGGGEDRQCGDQLVVDGQSPIGTGGGAGRTGAHTRHEGLRVGVDYRSGSDEILGGSFIEGVVAFPSGWEESRRPRSAGAGWLRGIRERLPNDG